MTEYTDNKKKSILILLFFIMCFVLSCGVSYFTRNTLIDTDSAAELVLSEELSKNMSLMSTEWYYSTELRVLNTQLVYMPLFAITGDWSTVRFISSVIMRVILLLSYFYFGRKLKLKWDSILFTSGLMMLPISIVYSRIVLLHSYYVPHGTIAFLALGLFIAYFECDSKKKKLVNLLLQFSIALIGSLNGLRYLQIIYLPLFVGTLFVLLFSKKVKVLNSPFEKNDLSSFIDCITKGDGKPFLLSVFTAIFAGIGYLINGKVLANIFAFRNYNETRLSTIDSVSFIETINNLIESMGYYYESNLISITGILSILLVFSYIYLIWRSIDFIRENGTEDIHKWLVPIFFLSILSVNCFIFFITKIVAEHYFMPIWLFIFPLIGILLEGASKNNGFTKRLITIIVCASLIGSGVYTSRYLIKRPEKSNMYYNGLGYRNVRHTDDIKPAIKFLQDNGYEVGFARFINSNVVIEMTDGQLECVPIEADGKEMKVYKWGTFKRYENPEYYSGKKIYLLLNTGGIDINDTIYLENEEYSNELLDKFINKHQLEEVYKDEHYTIYGF